MQSSPTFNALKKLGRGVFRVTWFGNVIRSGSADNVIVMFAPREISTDTGEVGFAFNKGIPVLLPVAYLRKFRLGDIWENGQFTGTRDTQVLETFQLNISPQTATVLPVGVPLNNSRLNPEYPLPFSIFEGHRDHTLSQCVRVELDDQSTFVVPCMELVRFYFGSSGSFLKRLFSGAFALNNLYTRASLNPITKVANIALSPDLHGTAASTVARIAFNAKAQSAARWIVNSNVACSAGKSNYYPKTTFPFHGTTDLTTYGRWIHHSNSRVFLVERISACTHPFPFEALYYTTSKSSAPQKSEKQNLKGKIDAENGISDDFPSASPSLTSNVGSSSLQAFGISVSAEENGLPFPDLAKKKVRCVRPSVQHPKVSNTKPQGSEFGGGDETSSSQIRSAEIAIDLNDEYLEEAPPDAVEIIERAISANNAAKANYMKWLPLSNSPVATQSSSLNLVRGDSFIGGSNEEYRNIWCGLLEISINEVAVPLLILIRNQVTRDIDDHMIFLALGNSTDQQEKVKIYCRAFAKDQGISIYREDIIQKFDTHQATDFYGVLRTLSMVPRPLIKRTFI